MEYNKDMINSIITMINNGITKNGLYRTLNSKEIKSIKDFDWTNYQNELIKYKNDIVVMNYNNKLYAITTDSEFSTNFYQLQ